MSRSPSEKTQLRNARYTINNLVRDLEACKRDRDTYRMRASKAEQEAKEWKDRFDRLLRYGNDSTVQADGTLRFTPDICRRFGITPEDVERASGK